MKVLLSGAFNPDFEALPEYLASALKSLGHRVVLFDHRSFLLPGRLRARWSACARFDRDLLNRRFLRLIRRERPDLVIVNQGMNLQGDTIQAIRDFGIRCVNWFSDFPAEFERGLAAAPFYDEFFLGSSWAAQRHREAGHARARWLPFACDPIRQGPDPPEGEGPSTTAVPPPRDIPAVVFVGSHYPERQILLRFLVGLPVGVWGPGWERACGDPHVAPMIRGGSLRPAAWRSLYARCRVALNIHYGSFGPPEVSGHLASTRTFEILACGAYQIVDRQGDVLRLFREGEHFAGFSSGDELRARVEEGLRDEGLRRRVARKGRAEVLARHTYAHRARRLLGDAAAPDFPMDSPVPEETAPAAPGHRAFALGDVR